LVIYEPTDFPYGPLPPFDPTLENFRGYGMVYETGQSYAMARPVGYSNGVLLAQNVTHTFSLDWIANPDGSGTMTGTIAGTPISLALTTTLNESFNAFGMGSGLVEVRSTGYTANFFADNLTYSIVPEPASVLLLGMAMTGLIGGRRRRVPR
jgi:hypothetical protein